MKVRLLPSTIESNGRPSLRQHQTCFVVDGSVAFDAGSLAMSATQDEFANIRDIVLSHAHLDHVSGLPLFIDDLFPVLEEPVRVHARAPVIDALEQHVFNWTIYPRFSELTNTHGPVIEYRTIDIGESFHVRHLAVTPIEVNHKVPSSGFVISDKSTTIAISGDTAETDGLWNAVNGLDSLDALFIECAFPNEHEELAEKSFHLTPRKLARELKRFDQRSTSIFAINLKPAYYGSIVAELAALEIERLEVMEPGRVYAF